MNINELSQKESRTLLRDTKKELLAMFKDEMDAARLKDIEGFETEIQGIYKKNFYWLKIKSGEFGAVGIEMFENGFYDDDSNSYSNLFEYALFDKKEIEKFKQKIQKDLEMMKCKKIFAPKDGNPLIKLEEMLQEAGEEKQKDDLVQKLMKTLKIESVDELELKLFNSYIYVVEKSNETEKFLAISEGRSTIRYYFFDQTIQVRKY